MTQSSRILSLAVFAAAVLLLPNKAAGQNYVTPTVKPTPPGQLIVLNNSTGANHTDPHVDGDLVCYTYQPGGSLIPSIRYFNLAAGTDNGVPTAPINQDFLCDVRGTAIVFTRDSSEADIFTFDTGPSTLTELDPTSGSMRFGPQIGDQTIAWQEFSTTQTASSIVAWDRASSSATVISSPSPVVNQNPGISPDGSVVAWQECPTTPNQCVIWRAVRSNAGTWSSQQLASQIGFVQFRPDTDGTIIVYSSGDPFDRTVGPGQVAWQTVGGGTEQVLSLPGSAALPSVSGGLLAFAYDATGSGNYQIAIYDTASNVLYNLTVDAVSSDTNNKALNDISVTQDGKVRVVWQELANGQWNLYAYMFNLPVGDFSFSPISPLTISAGGSGSANVTVNPVNGFSSTVDLSVSGAPVGVTAAASPAQVTPSGGNPASSILNVSVSPALAPTNFTLTVTGTSGTLTHSATADVTVTATTSSVGNLIGNLLGQGCIDNAGIANALTSKLSAAQGAASTQTAINILTALKNQINAQAAKHIGTACTIGGVAFNPVTVLLLDVQGLIDSLRVSAIPDPITGYVVDMNGVGVAGPAVSIFDAGGNVVATTTTDVTGFYFFATMSVLTPGANYTVAVTGLPAGFVSSTPAASPAFAWSGSGLMVGTFVLN